MSVVAYRGYSFKADGYPKRVIKVRVALCIPLYYVEHEDDVQRSHHNIANEASLRSMLGMVLTFCAHV